MKVEQIGILILAAGSSSRMGVSKQMLPIEGSSLLARTIRTALQTKIKNIVVVLGSNADEHRIEANEFPVTTLFNSDWKKGMGTSIKTGVNYFRSISSINGIIILVCDQPTLSSEILTSLINKQREAEKRIIASRYANTLGVPALFTSVTFQTLLALNDDDGAKKIILQNQSEVGVIDFPSGEIDLDTPDDYDNFIKHHTL
jgi:molybdenum cofactor cytidylyltransferase